MKKFLTLILILLSSCSYKDNEIKKIDNNLYLRKTEVTYNNDTDTAEILIVFSGIGGVSAIRLR